MYDNGKGWYGSSHRFGCYSILQVYDGPLGSRQPSRQNRLNGPRVCLSCIYTQQDPRSTSRISNILVCRRDSVHRVLGPQNNCSTPSLMQDKPMAVPSANLTPLPRCPSQGHGGAFGPPSPLEPSPTEQFWRVRRLSSQPQQPSTKKSHRDKNRRIIELSLASAVTSWCTCVHHVKDCKATPCATVQMLYVAHVENEAKYTTYTFGRGRTWVRGGRHS